MRTAWTSLCVTFLMAEAVAPSSRLDSAARSRAAVVVPASLPPSPRTRACSLPGACSQHHAAPRKGPYALRCGVESQPAQPPRPSAPCVSHPSTGLLRPTPVSPLSVAWARAAALRRLHDPALRVRGRHRLLGKWILDTLPVTWVFIRLAHQQGQWVLEPGLVLLNRLLESVSG